MNESRPFTESEFEFDRALRDLAAAIDYPPTPDLTSAVRHRIQSSRGNRWHLRLGRANHAMRPDNDMPVAPPRQLTASGTGGLPRRRLRSELLLTLGGTLVVLVAGMLYMLVFATSPSHRNQAAGPATVPDTLIANNFDRDSNTYSLLAYLPGGTAFQPVLDNGDRPVISPDGRQLFSTQEKRDGDTVHIGVVALSSDSLAPQWLSDVASFPAAAMTVSNLSSVGASVAVTADRVYVTPGVWGSHDPLTIVVLDRASGREIAHWSIPLNEKNAVGGATIYASPDGSELWLLDSLIDPATRQNEAMLYLRVDATNGRLVDKHKLIGADGQPYYPYGRMAPDGRTLYIVGAWAPYSGPLVISFFDLATGTLQPQLSLPLQASDIAPDHEEATSADGRTLYVLLPTLGKVIIVDVSSRSVTQVQPVEGLTAAAPSLFARVLGAIHDVFVQRAAAKFIFTGDMQLSPDGKRLYAVGVNGSGFEAVPAGIVAIDTTTWRVTDRWLSNAEVSFLQLRSDGSTLYVETSDETGQTALTVLDTRTGVASPLTSASDLPSNVTSLSQLYRERYGTSPDAKGGTTAPSAPRARLDATVDRASILAGDTVTIDARFVDPRSGMPVAPGQRTVRYDPPSTVTATFYHGEIGQGDVVVKLQADGYGHYRGSVVLSDPAVWSLQVDATHENAPGSRAEISGAVTVQAAFAGTDGRRYLLRLTTDPASPVAGHATTIRVAFVDAERGTPLPGGVTLADGTPASLETAFFLGQSGGMTSTTLQPDGHGMYAGQLTFATASDWTAQINVRIGDKAVSILTETVRVAAP